VPFVQPGETGKTIIPAASWQGPVAADQMYLMHYQDWPTKL